MYFGNTFHTKIIKKTNANYTMNDSSNRISRNVINQKVDIALNFYSNCTSASGRLCLQASYRDFALGSDGRSLPPDHITWTLS